MTRNSKWILLIVLSVLIAEIVPGQQSLEGYVLEASTNVGIAGVNIRIIESGTGTSTDEEGYFKLNNIELDTLTLLFSHIAYRDTLLKLKIPLESELVILLDQDSLGISSYVVTATRYRAKTEDIPQRINVLDKKRIDSYPSLNSDDLLKMIPGVVVNRSWGIFSRNSSVTMRGMPGSSRSLILINGVPLNKTAGGAVNWHLLAPDEIEQIEVVKGPGSALYGMNAMGGVINLITKKPKEKFTGMAGLGYGTYNTVKAALNLSGMNFIGKRGFYWQAGSFYRQGDGYFLDPEELRNEYSSKSFLKEGNLSGLVGYQFANRQKLELDYRFYQDQRGAGVKVVEKDGSFESFMENNLRLTYNGTYRNAVFSANGFYFNEQYYRQKENVNKSGEYRLDDTRTNKGDAGLWMNYTRQLADLHNVTAGIDIKHGTLKNEEIYRTSTDELYTNGNMIFSAVFLQDELNLFSNKLKLIAGLRFDMANFYDGQLQVINPGDRTGFVTPVDTMFQNSSWFEISPKLAIKYFVNENFDFYSSVSKGFMPPKLDDLVGSKKIRKGFKIANPELKPETIYSFEAGLNWRSFQRIKIEPSFYYSRGKNFQYMVATGDLLEEESLEPVIVYQRRNVSDVEVAGAELGIRYLITSNLIFNLSYAYNYSKILDYISSDETDITGKVLNEVPVNLIYSGITWQNRIVEVYLDFTFTGDQWYDEENTEIIEGYALLNFGLSKLIARKYELSMDIQDLFDTRFIDRKGYLSPGRFFMFEIKYMLKKGKNK